MPRETITLPYQVERLSILDEDGGVDDGLVPELDDEALLRMHRAMLTARRFDERLLRLQRQGRIGTFAPVSGQEASQIGAVAAITDDDWMIPAFRETAASLWRGTTPADLIVFNAGYNEGGGIPDDRNDFPIAVPVASQIPHAVGVAYGMAYRDDDLVALTFFGDGATSEGDFHEALNFAGILPAPVVFVCQNNHWAISMPRDRQTASKTLAQKGLAYGIPGIQVDGNDILAVYAATHEAVERARTERKATLIECVTYRLSLHTTADDPSKYREDEEVERWKERDPIPRLQGFLRGRDLLTADDIDALEQEIADELDAAWKAAESTMSDLGDPLVMFDHVYDDSPPALRAQREQLAAILGDSEDDDG